MTMDAGRQADGVLDMHEYVLDVAEAARLLDVSVDTIRRYARSGKLLHLRVQGERIIEYRFRPSDIEAMQAGRQTYTGTQAGMSTQAPMQAEAEMPALPASLTVLTELMAHLERRYQAEIAAKDALIDELRHRAVQAEQRLDELERVVADQAHSITAPVVIDNPDPASVHDEKLDQQSSEPAPSGSSDNDLLWAALAEQAQRHQSDRGEPAINVAPARSSRPWWAFWRH